MQFSHVRSCAWLWNLPGSQCVHCVEPRLAAYLPALQNWQDVEASFSEYSPRPQSTHSKPTTSEPFLPAGHFTQSDFSSFVISPDAQVRQLPSAAPLNFPVSQSVHWKEATTAFWPGRQTSHSLDPTMLENLPGLHLVQPSPGDEYLPRSQLRQTEEPSPAVYCPAGHSVHSSAFSSEYMCGSHAVHATLLRRSEYFPAAHASHEDCSGSACDLPRGHTWHSLAADSVALTSLSSSSHFAPSHIYGSLMAE
mmetsp:Transcript_11788/g.31801  ORF Transcript_11788/g.31801 Transcript_11788/m.31801 type:complete len:251 (-) Transcript_11788:3269-4021(-)